MDFLITFVHILIYVWLLFFGGAERLEGSFSTIFFFHPAMNVQELKFYATLSLALIPIYFYIL